MLRLNARLLCRPYPSTGSSYAFPEFKTTTGPVRRFLARRRANFTSRSAAMRAATVFGYGGFCVVAYALVCVGAHYLQMSSIAAHFMGSSAGIKDDERDGDGDGDGWSRYELRHGRNASSSSDLRSISGVYDPLRTVLQKDYTLATWVEVEETLKEGDVILMMGEGPLSWWATTAQFAYSFFKSPAMYYSHAAVVVKPAEYRYVPQQDSSNTAKRNKKLSAVEEVLRAETRRLDSKRVKVRGATILEVMGNTHFDVPDVHGNVVHRAVQLVEAERRLTSTRPAVAADGKRGSGTIEGHHHHQHQTTTTTTSANVTDGGSSSGSREGPVVHAFTHCAVRRLKDVDRTPAFLARVQDFVDRNEGRPCVQNMLFPLAFLSPNLYLRTDPTREATNAVCCAELIAELYQETGLFERRWRWVRVEDAEGRPVSPEADMQRTVFERARIALSTFIGPRHTYDAAADAEQRRALAARGLPRPTDADLHPTNAVAVPPLLVYDRVHCRKEDEPLHPLHARLPLPVMAPYTCVENWVVLDDPALQQHSVEGCEALSQAERQSLLEHLNGLTPRHQQQKKNGLGGGDPAAAKMAAIEKLNTTTTATGQAVVLSSDSPLYRPAMPLPAGTLARTTDGGLAQLQHYHRHSAMVTMPYSWTAGEAERSLDFANSNRMQRFGFAALDSTPEGQWLLERSRRASEESPSAPAMVSGPRNSNSAAAAAVVNTGTTSMVDGGGVHAGQTMLIDLMAVVEEEARARGIPLPEVPPGPRLGLELRMERPRMIHFGGSAEEGIWESGQE